MATDELNEQLIAFHQSTAEILDKVVMAITELNERVTALEQRARDEEAQLAEKIPFRRPQ